MKKNSIGFLSACADSRKCCSLPFHNVNNVIKNLIGRVAPAALLLIGAVSPALAGEVGVTNSWGSSHRLGVGSYHLSTVSNRHESGGVYSSAFKTEFGLLPPLEGQHKPSGLYTATASATSFMSYREDTKTNFRENGKFVFGSTNFSHTVSAFGN